MIHKALPTIDPRSVGIMFGWAMPEFFLSHKLFMAYIAKTYEKVDVCTWTLREFDIEPCKVDRLMYAVNCADVVQAERVKHVSNLHIKLWLGWRKKTKLPDVYIGSMNASETGPIDLMVRVPPAQAKILVELYDHIWRLASKKQDTFDEDAHYELLEDVMGPHGQG